MGHGTRGYSEKSIYNVMAETGAQLSGQITRDMSVWTLRSLTAPKKLKRSVDVLHSILTEPTFPKKIFERLRYQERVKILQSQEDPMYLATSAFFKSIYPNSGYGHPRLGTPETLKGIQVEDSQQFYQKYYVAKNASIVLVGNLSLQHAKRLANQLSRNLPVGEGSTCYRTEDQTKKSSRIY